MTPKNKLQEAVNAEFVTYRNCATHTPSELFASIVEKVQGMNAKHPRCTEVCVQYYKFAEFEQIVAKVGTNDLALLTFTPIRRWL